PGRAARSRRRQRRRAERAARQRRALARAAVWALFRLSAQALAESPALSAQPCWVHVRFATHLERGDRRAVLRPGPVRARLPLVHGHDAQRIRRYAASHPREDHGAALRGPGRRARDGPADGAALYGRSDGLERIIRGWERGSRPLHARLKWTTT